MIKIREKFILDKTGHKKEVVIPYRDYEHLMEDLHDLIVVAERKDERNISFNEMKKKLKMNGLI